MALTFDGPNKRIILDSASVSADDIWSRWVDWHQLNPQWPIAMRSLGGDSLGGSLYVATYFFLQNGWRVRPMEADHTLELTGNLTVDGGGSPIVPTLGVYTVLAQYTVPVQAQAVGITGGSGGSTPIVRHGTGALSAGNSTIRYVPLRAGTGSLTVAASVVTGTGLVGNTLIGALEASEAVVAGIGSSVYYSTYFGIGNVDADPATVEGIGHREYSFSAGLTTENSTVEGTGNLVINGSGVLETGNSEISVSIILAKYLTGNLSTGLSSVSGTGVISHIVTGTLVASRSYVYNSTDIKVLGNLTTGVSSISCAIQVIPEYTYFEVFSSLDIDNNFDVNSSLSSITRYGHGAFKAINVVVEGYGRAFGTDSGVSGAGRLYAGAAIVHGIIRHYDGTVTYPEFSIKVLPIQRIIKVIRPSTIIQVTK